ncbi:MAG: hypothetical protein A2007_00810 [Verrucomicrobia bacterium GWC2_42_7]|nr:MAG: hypothetical protein A2007_00810 [Verrucomicrobia bacterium GWC2_42_7]
MGRHGNLSFFRKKGFRVPINAIIYTNKMPKASPLEVPGAGGEQNIHSVFLCTTRPRSELRTKPDE